MFRESFHNTIREDGQVLIDFETQAENQEDLVLEVFKKHRTPMAWFEVGALINMNECSLKRALTNLCSDKVNSKNELIRKKVLVKTSTKVKGIHGKNCYRYALYG